MCEQPPERVETLLASHHLLLAMKQNPPYLTLMNSAVLSMWNTEKESDGVTAWSCTVGVSHVSVKHGMSYRAVMLSGCLACSPVTVH